MGSSALVDRKPREFAVSTVIEFIKTSEFLQRCLDLCLNLIFVLVATNMEILS